VRHDLSDNFAQNEHGDPWWEEFYRCDSDDDRQRQRDVWALRDAVHGGEYDRLYRHLEDTGASESELNTVVASANHAIHTIANHQIELYLRPSPFPGEDGGGRGAAPIQLALRDEFFQFEEDADGNKHLKYRILAANGANQSGKTESLGNCVCEYLRDHAVNGDIFWMISRTTKTMRDIPLKTLWKFLPREMFDGREYSPLTGFGQAQTLKLKLPGNRGYVEVWLWTEEMDLIVIESARLTGVWWTECHREALFDALQPRLAAKGGWMAMDYVPMQGWHAQKIRIPSETTAKDLVYHTRFCMAYNQHNLGPGEVAKQRRLMSKEMAAVRIDGKEGGGEGAVYTQFLAAKHVLQPFEIPEDWPRHRMLDWGNRHHTAFLWGTIAPIGFKLDGPEDEDGNWWRKTFNEASDQERLIVYREYTCTQTAVFEQMPVILGKSINKDGTPEKYVGPVICDPAIFKKDQGNMRSIADWYKDGGLSCIPGPRVQKHGEHAVVEMVRMRFVTNTLYFFDGCPMCISNHQSWKYKTNPDGDSTAAEPYEDKDNDTCDALKYWVATKPCYSGPRHDIIDTLGRPSNDRLIVGGEGEEGYYAKTPEEHMVGGSYGEMFDE
jgi:hypothetical protein